MYTHDGRPRDNGAMVARAVHVNLPKASVHALHPHPNTAGTPTEEPGWAPLGPSAICKLRATKGAALPPQEIPETQGPCADLKGFCIKALTVRRCIPR